MSSRRIGSPNRVTQGENRNQEEKEIEKGLFLKKKKKKNLRDWHAPSRGWVCPTGHVWIRSHTS
jgi:hypothetical protein